MDEEEMSGNAAEALEGLTEREQVYVLHRSTGKSQRAAAEEAGVSEASSRALGYRMDHDPRVQQAIEELRKYQQVEVTDELVRNMLLKEALEAGSSRDRREAAHLLGKTKGMFRDVVDTTTHASPMEYLDEVEKVLGKEVRDAMAKELGIAED